MSFKICHEVDYGDSKDQVGQVVHDGEVPVIHGDEVGHRDETVEGDDVRRSFLRLLAPIQARLFAQFLALLPTLFLAVQQNKGFQSTEW